MTAPHLDDEQLSALLDEETAEPHLSSCASCSDRLGDLTAARQLLASAPPPLAPDVLDGFIARALETLDAESETTVGPPVDLPVDLRDRRSRRRPPPTWLISAAAAIAVLAGVAGLLRASDGDGGGAGLTALDAEKSAGDGATAPADESLAAGAPAPSAADPEVVSSDLGDQSDPAALAAILRDSPTGGAAVGGQAQRTTSDALESEAGADAPAVVAPTAGAATAAPPSTAAQDRARCRAEADRIGAGRLGALVSTSSVRWKGEAAEVLVFLLTEPAGGVTRQALVLSRPACGLLADPRF